MKKYSISFLILFTISFAEIVSPENGSTLNYRHVLFEWEQVPNASAYQFFIVREAGVVQTMTVTTESLQYILSDPTFFYWQNPYSWYVRPIYDDGSLGDKIGGGNYDFILGSSRSNANINQYNSEAYSDGITIFSSFLDYYSAAIDKDGNEIWNTGDNNLVFYNTDYYGQLFGAQYNSDLINNLPVVEYDMNSNITWQEPNEHFAHHEMLQLPNGNYMSIVEDVRNGPIPVNLPNSLTLLFQLLGYIADGTTSEFPWVGDRIVEWDRDTGEEVWSWSTFDYYNMMDYDEIAGTWTAAFNDGRFDWTHANAFWYSEEENAVYFSARHLSRITKIDYNTGNIIWNMGLDMPSGDVHCGQDIGFSFQHSVMSLENGNIVTLDNGNISTQINGTPYPTTRGLEIAVEENTDSVCNASLAWSYDLPEQLFGFASGNVQKLDNGNYLITTVGDGGTTLEVSPNNEVIWEAKYNLAFPNGAVYRANRISSLYPTAFSVVIQNLYINDSNIMGVDYSDGYVDIIIYNDGSLDNTFCIQSECYEINSHENLSISIPHESDIISFDIIPTNREDLTKTVTINIFGMPNCDEGYTYYELEDIPNSTIVLGGGQCFNDVDLSALNDIITENNINIDDPIELGLQNWSNGRITRLQAGDYYTGGSNPEEGIVVNLTTLPESVGNMENLGILYVDRNSLTSLPNSITNLSNLLYLVMSFNNITHLPDDIGSLTNLIWIDAGYNSLQSIPESIGNLPILQYLWIFNNELTSLPDSICNLNLNWNGTDSAFLPYFGSGGNQLCGDLPSCIESSDNINTSIDPLYYSFLITVEQDCEEISCTVMDLNNDGIINVIDIINIVNIIIEGGTSDENIECAADVNGDSIINVIDIIQIVNHIIG